MPDVFVTAFETYSRSKQLDEGANGTVFAVKSSHGEPFAIKLLKPGTFNLSKDKLRRFKNELFYSLRANHPHIVSVSDYGFVELGGNNCPFYVMPLYDGTLAAVKKDGIGAESKVKYFLDALAGVREAHQKGVVHRDLKPTNLLYDRNNDAIVVADFGIARFSEEWLHTYVETGGERLANFQYAAPEQRQKGANVTHLADIFSLGLILNELFTGEIIQGVNHKKVADADRSFAYLDPVIDRMVQQDPAKRYQNIDQIILDLKISAGQEQSKIRISELLASPTSLLERDPIRNNPVRVSGADYKPNEKLLILELSPKPTRLWVDSFAELNPGNDYLAGNFPRDVPVENGAMFLRVREEDAPCMKEIVDKWLDRMVEHYELSCKRREADFLAGEEYTRRREIEQEESRARVLSRIKV